MTIKKIIASIAMIAMFGTITLNVFAASTVIDSVTYDSGADTVTVADAETDFSTDAVSTFRIVDQNNATVAGVTVAEVTANNNGGFVVNVAAIAGTLDAGGIFSVSFVTAAGTFGGATFTVANADQIGVSANVLPILSMKVVGAIDFGDLVIDTVSTSATTTAITVNTNAASGYNVKVANLGLKDGAFQIPDAGVAENLTTGYGYGINATVTAGATIDAKASAAATIDAAFDGGATTDVSGMSTTPATLVSTSGPVSNQVTTVTYYSRISALQETGTYADTVTYSITGSF